jgi:sortase A
VEATNTRHSFWDVVGVVGRSLVVLGLSVCGFALYLTVGTSLSEHHAQALLAERLDLPSPHNLVPSGRTAVRGQPTPPIGTAIGRLMIPAIGVNQVIIEGTGDAQLEAGPGHYPGTVLPGEAGDAAIAGHRTTWGRPFWSLDRLRTGDDIIVESPLGRFTFAVTGTTTVLPTDLGAILPSTTPTLTLTTCTPKFSASHRLVVHATLQRAAVPRTAVRLRWAPPTTPPAAPSAVDLALALALTVLAAVSTVVLWRRQRVASALVGLGGVAALLMTYTLIARALPGGF